MTKGPLSALNLARGGAVKTGIVGAHTASPAQDARLLASGWKLPRFLVALLTEALATPKGCAVECQYERDCCAARPAKQS